MSISDKYASRKVTELQALLDVSKKIHDFIKLQAENEASLTAAITTENDESILQKIGHIQKQIAYANINQEITSYILKRTRGSEKLLLAYQHEQEQKK